MESLRVRELSQCLEYVVALFQAEYKARAQFLVKRAPHPIRVAFRKSLPNPVQAQEDTGTVEDPYGITATSRSYYFEASVTLPAFALFFKSSTMCPGSILP